MPAGFKRQPAPPPPLRGGLGSISEAGEAVAIAEHLKHVALSSDPIWLVGSLGLDLRTLTGWRKVFHGGLFVEPHMPELSEFKSYFIGALQVKPCLETICLSRSGIPFIKLERQFQHFKCQNMDILSASFWHFKCQYD